MTSQYTREINDSCPYATDEELDWMGETSSKLSQDALVVMLGVGPGVMLLGLEDGRLDLEVAAIDNRSFNYAQAHLQGRVNDSRNVHFILGDSVEVGREWDRKVDLLIVDTDHTEETTRREIEVWLPRVKTRGLVFFHDYDPSGTTFDEKEHYPGVKRAVDDLMSKYTFVGRVGTAAIYRKIGARSK